MDFHKLQQKLFSLDPTDPREDLAKLKAQASGGAQAAPTIPQPVVESVEVPEGSLQMDKNYSLSDFAALAGVTAPTQRIPEPVVESRPDPIIVQDKDARIAQLEERVARLEELLTEKSVSKAQQRFMGMVHAAKKGETPASPEVAKAAKGMSKKAAKDFAKTKHKGLPEKKKTSETRSIKDELMAKLAEYELKRK